VWRYTPRQIAAYCALAGRRQKYEMARQLSVTALASQGRSKDINKRLKDLQKE